MDGGACQLAGVPPEQCGAGFVADNGGCLATTADQACAGATMSVPGDATCRDIVACGSGTWGDIDTTGSVVFVDQGYLAGDGDGSVAKPFPTIGEALAVATNDATIAIAAGDYNEPISVGTTPLTLWGRCPAMVNISSVGSYGVHQQGAGPITVRGLSITGMRGVGVFDGVAELRELWLHQLNGVGVWVAGESVDTQVSIDDVRIDDVVDTGILVLGGAVVANGVDLSNVAQTPQGSFGRGVDVEHNNFRRGLLTLSQSVIFNVVEYGIYISGSDANVDRVLVRDVAYANDIDPGRGIHVRVNDAGDSSTATISRTVIERAAEVGLWADGELTLVENTSIRDVLATPQGTFGFGVSAFAGPGGAASETILRQISIERVNSAAILTVGAIVNVEGVLIRDVAPEPASQVFGRGVVAQSFGMVTIPTVTVRWSALFGTHDVALSSFHGELTVDATLIDGVKVNPLDGFFGDGIDAFGGVPPGTVTLTNSEVKNAARAGIANFNSIVTMSNNRFGCNGIDLNGENLSGAFVFDDQGDNVCGCGDSYSSCKVISANLEPPTAPPIQQ
jgi:hypothetical protein